jgi:hypothetical protein
MSQYSLGRPHFVPPAKKNCNIGNKYMIEVINSYHSTSQTKMSIGPISLCNPWSCLPISSLHSGCFHKAGWSLISTKCSPSIWTLSQPRQTANINLKILILSEIYLRSAQFLLHVFMSQKQTHCIRALDIMSLTTFIAALSNTERALACRHCSSPSGKRYLS